MEELRKTLEKAQLNNWFLRFPQNINQFRKENVAVISSNPEGKKRK